MNSVRFFSLMMILLLGFACAGTPDIPEMGTPDSQVFLKKCTACHSWPHPARHSREEWDFYLDLMETHMKNKGIPFSSEEKGIIQSYLHRNAR